MPKPHAIISNTYHIDSFHFPTLTQGFCTKVYIAVVYRFQNTAYQATKRIGVSSDTLMLICTITIDNEQNRQIPMLRPLSPLQSTTKCLAKPLRTSLNQLVSNFSATSLPCRWISW